VDREADVLEQRVKARALGSRDRQTLERVRRQQEEGIEAQGHHPLHRKRRAHGAFRQTPLEGREHPARQRQHADPQQHRAFMIAPGAGQLVDQRLHRVRIAGDQLDRQISDRKGPEQHRESQHREQRLHHGSGPGIDRQRIDLALRGLQREGARDHL
jgi:hypothetical protein